MIVGTDFEGARLYAIYQLERNLSPAITFHSLFHTMNEVCPATELFAAKEGISGQDLQLLRTAAVFHDIGFTEQFRDHEVASARLAGQALPDFGFTKYQVSAIQSMILATRPPLKPKTLEEEVLADADLDFLGRGNFLERSQDLRIELAALGGPIDEEKWNESQLKFMQSHRYFTQAAQTLRGPTKQRNIQILAELVAKSQNPNRLSYVQTSKS